MSVVLLAGLMSGAASEPVGFREQCGRQLWVTYRSFNKELERTGQFAAFGVTNRCFFAVHTVQGGAKTIRLPQKVACVKDLLTGETLGTDTDQFSCTFTTPDTKLFGF